jgi:LuxR family quorum-sensing system transcriptional regulator CciR
MSAFRAAADFARTISDIRTRQGLSDALAEACERMGIRYFALSHHIDFGRDPLGLRLHNYPEGWEEYYDANGLGLSDPIHRASQFMAGGFLWREVPRIISLLPSDVKLLERGRTIGLGEGVTVPAHVPGEARGSCTFAAAVGQDLPGDVLPWAQSVGIFAFEGARRLVRRPCANRVRVSDRQRECIALAGRGLSNKQIARLLGIGYETVLEHFREARARLGATNRTELVVILLADGQLCLDDVMPHIRRAFARR